MLKDTQLHILADSDAHEVVHQVQVTLNLLYVISVLKFSMKEIFCASLL